MPEFDEKQEKRGSSRAKKQIQTRPGPRRDGGRGRTPAAELASLVRTETGRDARGVRIHADATADQKARRLGAQAVTEGQEVFFAEEAYRPSTQAGRRLIGHELAHGLQQAEGGRGTPAAQAALEQEADAAGERLARGEPVTVRRRAAPGSLLLKEEKKAAPSIAEHKEEIGPAPLRGTISGPGFTVEYVYGVVKAAKSATLALTVPEGVGLSVSPLSDVAAGEMRVEGSGGVKARTVTIAVSASAKGTPRARVNFTKGSAGYIVVFHFPAAV
ncbi:MAG: DUF4157 domain-containing protein [Desulfobacterales bacterium]|nr:MAG: DUF4157 domain-containing protein [Desulfobacterales bacterium]